MNYTEALHLAWALYHAVRGGNTRAVAACLAEGADPNDSSAFSLLYGGRPTFLHLACAGSHVECARLLLEAGADPLALDGMRKTPMHCIATGVRNGPALVRLLLSAAPQALQARDSSGHTPLKLALHFACQGTLHIAVTMLDLAPAQPAAELLAWLGQSLGTPQHVAALYMAVVSRQPLSVSEWELVPAPCAGLGAALPAVLRRSEAEAALLVARLPPDAQQRLRTVALCLARAQRGLSAPLPTPLVHEWLALAVAEPEIDALLASGRTDAGA